MARTAGPGADLRLFVADNRHNLHGKIAVFDRQLALVGTYNLDPLSMALNSELVAAIWSPPFAAEILQGREQAMSEGQALVQYRIARTPQGEPRRDAAGKIEVEFGAEDHMDLAEMDTIRQYRRLFSLLSRVKGDFPWY